MITFCSFSIGHISACYYVPLLRREDDSGPAVVGQPLSPDTDSKTKLLCGVESPTESPLSIRALAGPMSPKQVNEVAKVLVVKFCDKY